MYHLYQGTNMNKKQILASLNNIANELDNLSLFQEANTLTQIMTKIASDDWDDFKNATTGFTCPLCDGFLVDGKCPKCKNKNKEIVKTLKHDKNYNELKEEVNRGISEIISQVQRPKVKNPKTEIQRFRRFLKNYLFHINDSDRVYKSYKYYARNDEDGFFRTMLELCDYVDYFKEKHNLESRELNRMILK